MTLWDEFKNLETTPRKLREFGLLVGAVFCLLGGLFLWRGREAYVYFFYLGIGLFSLGILWPVSLRVLYQAWMGLALVLGWVVSRVLLTLLFYLTVTPIGILSRISGKDFLDLKFKDGKDSYWIPRKNISAKEDCEKQY